MSLSPKTVITAKNTWKFCGDSYHLLPQLVGMGCWLWLPRAPTITGIFAPRHRPWCVLSSWALPQRGRTKDLRAAVYKQHHPIPEKAWKSCLDAISLNFFCQSKLFAKLRLLLDDLYYKILSLLTREKTRKLIFTFFRDVTMHLTCLLVQPSSCANPPSPLWLSFLRFLLSMIL